MENDIKQFLENIQELKQKKFKVTQISAGKDIQCQPLTFKQQKDLISTIADGTAGVIRFQKILNDILLENTENDTLLVTDKIPIILKLRIESIGNIIKIDDVDFDISSISKVSGKSKFTNNFKIEDSVNIELEVPSLKEENKILSYAIESIKNEKDAGKNIGNVYTYEIIKFIKSVVFGENELIFSQIPVKDRVKVVENLPLSINKKIVKYIESIKEVESDMLKIDINGDVKTIDIDVSFFDN